MFNDLIIELAPPANRVGKCEGGKERHLTEAAVMLAYGMHLLRTVPELDMVEVHPDGEHAKRFDIAQWLSERGFVMHECFGRTAYCGSYGRGNHVIKVTSTPGKGDVVASTARVSIVAECKGGIVNSKHSGPSSRLRKGLCEAVGQLMAAPLIGRQVAVVPLTDVTKRLAKKLAPRAKDAGIEISLVDEFGQVVDVVS